MYLKLFVQNKRCYKLNTNRIITIRFIISALVILQKSIALTSEENITASNPYQLHNGQDVNNTKTENTPQLSIIILHRSLAPSFLSKKHKMVTYHSSK